MSVRISFAPISPKPVGDHDRKKRQAIFTLDVHPDGSRLATGGIDAIIRVWTAAPIKNERLAGNDKVPKQLSTLDQHSGAYRVLVLPSQSD